MSTQRSLRSRDISAVDNNNSQLGTQQQGGYSGASAPSERDTADNESQNDAGGRDNDQEDDDEVEEIQRDPPRPNLRQFAPQYEEEAAELARLRDWQESTKTREELRSLRELRARYEAGDITATRDIFRNPRDSAVGPNQPSSVLPRPEPPQKYAKANRAEFNRWERDCEGYFERAPANFRAEQQKVDFGVMYISEPLKTLWRSHALVEEVASPLWLPTWAGLKSVMLNALGTPHERRQMAFEQLKQCRQRASESPTDLLDRLRPLWEELGTFITPELQTIEYASALRQDIQRDIERLPLDMRATIPAIEEQANIIWRRTGPREGTKNDHVKDKGKRLRESDDKSDRETKGKSTAKRTKWRQFKPKRGGKQGSTTERKKFICFKCGEPDHKASDCSNAAKPGSDPRENKSEKDKGKKS